MYQSKKPMTPKDLTTDSGARVPIIENYKPTRQQQTYEISSTLQQLATKL